MSKPKHYDALILGSGQAGTPLATHIKCLGQSVCLVERSHIAGCCVNEGCTPTKTMVASGRIAYLARRASEYGVGTGSGVAIDMQKVRQRKRDIVDRFRGGSEKRLANAGVDVLMGEAKFVGAKEVEVTPVEGGDGKKVSADKIFINVGCRPSRPDFPGLEDVAQERILDSTSIQELGVVPKHLVVLGGGTIGLEFGQLFKRLGANVTMVHRGPKLLGRKDDPELAECMQTILTEDGMDLLLDSTIEKVSKENDSELPIALSVTGPRSTTIKASHILVATGRVPNTDTMNLSAAGISTLPSGHIKASASLETNIEGIFALGDVKGGPAFTHISYDDFRIIRNNVFTPNTTTTLSTTTRQPLIPAVTFTDPQLAHIGPKYHELPRDRSLVSYSMPGSWIARGLETDETRGMIKAVIDTETNQIVSFSAISVEAGEIMSVVQMAMLGGLTWMDLRDGVFAHPCWSEALNNLWGGERKEVVL